MQNFQPPAPSPSARFRVRRAAIVAVSARSKSHDRRNREQNLGTATRVAENERSSLGEREKEGGERQSGSSIPLSCQHNRASSQANTCCRARDANQPLVSPLDHSFTTDTTGYRYIVAVTDRESRPASHKHLSRPQCQPANWPTRLSDQPRWSRSTQSRSIGRVLVS